jgi:hypothetical protein
MLQNNRPISEQLVQRRQEIEQQKTQIAEAKKRIPSSSTYAQRLQQQSGISGARVRQQESQQRAIVTQAEQAASSSEQQLNEISKQLEKSQSQRVELQSKADSLKQQIEDIKKRAAENVGAGRSKNVGRELQVQLAKLQGEYSILSEASANLSEGATYEDLEKIKQQAKSYGSSLASQEKQSLKSFEQSKAQKEAFAKKEGFSSYQDYLKEVKNKGGTFQTTYDTSNLTVPQVEGQKIQPEQSLTYVKPISERLAFLEKSPVGRAAYSGIKPYVEKANQPIAQLGGFIELNKETGELTQRYIPVPETKRFLGINVPTSEFDQRSLGYKFLSTEVYAASETARILAEKTKYTMQPRNQTYTQIRYGETIQNYRPGGQYTKGQIYFTKEVNVPKQTKYVINPSLAKKSVKVASIFDIGSQALAFGESIGEETAKGTTPFKFITKYPYETLATATFGFSSLVSKATKTLEPFVFVGEKVVSKPIPQFVKVSTILPKTLLYTAKVAEPFAIGGATYLALRNIPTETGEKRSKLEAGIGGLFAFGLVSGVRVKQEIKMRTPGYLGMTPIELAKLKKLNELAIQKYALEEQAIRKVRTGLSRTRTRLELQRQRFGLTQVPPVMSDVVKIGQSRFQTVGEEARANINLQLQREAVSQIQKRNLKPVSTSFTREVQESSLLARPEKQYMASGTLGDKMVQVDLPTLSIKNFPQEKPQTFYSGLFAQEVETIGGGKAQKGILSLSRLYTKEGKLLQKGIDLGQTMGSRTIFRRFVESPNIYSKLKVQPIETAGGQLISQPQLKIVKSRMKYEGISIVTTNKPKTVFKIENLDTGQAIETRIYPSKTKVAYTKPELVTIEKFNQGLGKRYTQKEINALNKRGVSFTKEVTVESVYTLPKERVVTVNEFETAQGKVTVVKNKEYNKFYKKGGIITQFDIKSLPKVKKEASKDFFEFVATEQTKTPLEVKGDYSKIKVTSGEQQSIVVPKEVPVQTNIELQKKVSGLEILPSKRINTKISPTGFMEGKGLPSMVSGTGLELPVAFGAVSSVEDITFARPEMTLQRTNINERLTLQNTIQSNQKINNLEVIKMNRRLNEPVLIKENLRLVELPTFKENIRLDQLPKFKQPEVNKTRQRSPTITRLTEVTKQTPPTRAKQPPRKTPRVYPFTFGAGNKKGERQQVGQDEFEAFVRKAGKDISLGKKESQKAAEEALVGKLKGTIAASGFITKGEKKLKVSELNIKSPEFSTSKVSEYRIVQRKEKRFGTRPETREAQAFRKAKGYFK